MTTRFDALSTQDQIIELYMATLGRAPDQEGLNYWVGRVEGTVEPEQGALTIEQVATSFFEQPETQTKYPTLFDTEANSLEDYTAFVTSLYNTVFDREPDDEGLDYWAGELDAGNVNVSQFVLAFLRGVKLDADPEEDAGMLVSLRDVGLDFAESIEYPDDGHPEVSAEEQTFLDNAAEVVTLVNEHDGDTAAAKEFIDTLEGGSTEPSYALTADPESAKEGETVVFTLSTDTASEDDQSFIITVAGTADGDDLEPFVTELVLPAGETEATFDIQTMQDDAEEETETLQVMVKTDDGKAVADTTVEIENVPTGMEGYTLTADPESAKEGETFKFTLVVDTPSEEDQTFTIAVSGTADEDDVEPFEAEVVLAAGESEVSFEIEAKQDDLDAEGTETLKVIVETQDGELVADTTVEIQDVPVSGNTVELSADVDGGTDDAGQGDITYTVATGVYSYTIENFGEGDVLAFPEEASASTPTFVNSDVNDGAVILKWGTSSTNIVEITLTGLSDAYDRQLMGDPAEDFHHVFGQDSFVFI